MFRPEIKTNEFIHIMVTNQCNRWCPFCFDENRKFGKHITKENYIKILDTAKYNCINEVLLLGGEPLLHPDIVELCRIAKEDYGFKTMITTNYAKPDVLLQCDKYLDSINISYYNQAELPDPSLYTADISLSALMYKNRLDNKQELDEFIDKYKDLYTIRLATLEPTPRFPKELCDISKFLDTLEFDDKITLFGQIEGDIYRGILIKRHDIVLDKFEQPFSFNGHVNGDYDRGWTDKYVDEQRGEIVFSSPIGNIRTYKEFDALANKLHDIYIYDQQEYVTGIVYNKEKDTYVLVKQYRYGIDKFTYECPGGGKDYLEDATAAFKREVKEETGYTITHIKPLGSFYQNTGNSKGKVYFFYAETDTKEEQNLTEFEHIEVVEASKEEFDKYIGKSDFILSQFLYMRYKNELS